MLPITIIFLLENQFLILRKYSIIIGSLFTQFLIINLCFFYIDTVELFIELTTVINFIFALYLIIEILNYEYRQKPAKFL